MAKKKKSEEQTDTTPTLTSEPTKTIFDHIKQIKSGKQSEYYDNLNDASRKTFVKYIIMMGLSMDKNAIEGISFISKYFEVLPDKQFYQVCCDVVPHSYKYDKWIKSSKPKFNVKLLTILANNYNISKYDAYDYCNYYFSNESTVSELIELLSRRGLDDKEIETLLKGANE